LPYKCKQSQNTDDTISFNDIHLHRKSSDKDRCNAYGNKLLNMCKNNNIYIANGRVGNDKNIGKVTSKESNSTVDYFIIASELFPFITEFGIIDFDPFTYQLKDCFHC
jgi:hypothetical protein